MTASSTSGTYEVTRTYVSRSEATQYQRTINQDKTVTIQWFEHTGLKSLTLPEGSDCHNCANNYARKIFKLLGLQTDFNINRVHCRFDAYTAFRDSDTIFRGRANTLCKDYTK